MYNLDPNAEKIPTRKAFGEALLKMGKKYKNVVVLDADLSGSVQTEKFAKEFPERHFQMGIAEQNMIGAAAGFATRGKIPFVCSFAVFATGRSWEIIRNSVCYPNLNVKILGSHAGIGLGEDGASHQALEDIAIMRVLPNMKVVCPCDAAETLSAMSAVMEDYGPTYIRVNRQATSVIYVGTARDESLSGGNGGLSIGKVGGGVKNEGEESFLNGGLSVRKVGGSVKIDEEAKIGKGGLNENGHGANKAVLVNFKFGKSDVLFGKELFDGKKRADVCIFATGALVSSCLLAAKKLEEGDGKKVIIVNVSSIKPIDEKTILECALKSKICVTAEDHSVIGGLGGAVSEVLAENGVGKRLFRIGMKDKFGESGSSQDLYKKYGFDEEGVYKQVRDLLKNN
jgi:transketolase